MKRRLPSLERSIHDTLLARLTVLERFSRETEPLQCILRQGNEVIDLKGLAYTITENNDCKICKVDQKAGNWGRVNCCSSSVRAAHLQNSSGVWRSSSLLFGLCLVDEFASFKLQSNVLRAH